MSPVIWYGMSIVSIGVLLLMGVFTTNTMFFDQVSPYSRIFVPFSRPRVVGSILQTWRTRRSRKTNHVEQIQHLVSTFHFILRITKQFAIKYVLDANDFIDPYGRLDTTTPAPIISCGFEK